MRQSESQWPIKEAERLVAGHGDTLAERRQTTRALGGGERRGVAHERIKIHAFGNRAGRRFDQRIDTGDFFGLDQAEMPVGHTQRLVVADGAETRDIAGGERFAQHGLMTIGRDAV